MIIVNSHEAKINFSRLMTQIANGQEIIITRSGQDFAKVVPIKKINHKRTPGQDKDSAWVADDFDAALPDELQKYFV
ncbi:type II toxin-antitoxin system Phd/YefM family antitoxin [sulfur-oxidizing endosymbiont of Gigantopelta aegis]|uniref:type II toxin-antitoxin system Phd/YefM family antitoxin n=1 Tax=sulfur-oxidizing endosymbiont of Gigantopelta aegis TaxID=2794934 RepID=UPI0018DBBADC|nr:type II toxin-antitoxin system prevent-host-death family antitoxin [sulfur-oxidizing endosymbiont of Gigantopelta aegis]